MKTLRPLAFTQATWHYRPWYSNEYSVTNAHFAYAVMKDGTKIQLLERTNCEPIDLAQVDYVLLTDGRKLPVS